MFTYTLIYAWNDLFATLVLLLRFRVFITFFLWIGYIEIFHVIEFPLHRISIICNIINM